VGGNRIEALIGEGLDDQGGGLAVVFDAQDFLARLPHLTRFRSSQEAKRFAFIRKLRLMTAKCRGEAPSPRLALSRSTGAGEKRMISVAVAGRADR
jgi:hypothetical protein